MNNSYFVVVVQTKYPDYPCLSGYHIEAPNKHDAGIQARKNFAADFGFGYAFTKVDYIRQTAPAPVTGKK